MSDVLCDLQSEKRVSVQSTCGPGDVCGAGSVSCTGPDFSPLSYGLSSGPSDAGNTDPFSTGDGSVAGASWMLEISQ